jgi:hypothetical protein
MPAQHFAQMRRRMQREERVKESVGSVPRFPVRERGVKTRFYFSLDSNLMKTVGSSTAQRRTAPGERLARIISFTPLLNPFCSDLDSRLLNRLLVTATGPTGFRDTSEL